MALCAASAAARTAAVFGFEVGERGVAGRLERGGDVGGLRVVVLVDRLVGDVDRVVAGVDLGLLGGEQRGERLRRRTRAGDCSARSRRSASSSVAVSSRTSLVERLGARLHVVGVVAHDERRTRRARARPPAGSPW